MLASFLSVEDDTENMWKKPTLNRWLSYALLSEKTYLRQNKFISSFATSFTKELMRQHGTGKPLHCCSLLSEALKATLRRVFICASVQYCPQEYDLLRQHCTGKSVCSVVLEAQDNIAQGKIMYNGVLIHFGQHYIGK